ncbi:hypothetical protein IAR55_001055 [Kwoniella newhampshirensis]|uniref:Uncharacterized protein n=1 Tax=Kwoniella newhampshirensis TaxID=1651941 RepID=A0AAW0Z4N7_9TREE
MNDTAICQAYEPILTCPHKTIPSPPKIRIPASIAQPLYSTFQERMSDDLHPMLLLLLLARSFAMKALIPIRPVLHCISELIIDPAIRLVSSVMGDGKNQMIALLAVVIIILLHCIGSRARSAKFTSLYGGIGNELEELGFEKKRDRSMVQNTSVRSVRRSPSSKKVVRSTIVTIKPCTSGHKPHTNIKTRPGTTSNSIDTDSIDSQTDLELKTGSDIGRQSFSSPHTNLTKLLIPRTSSIWPERYQAALAMAIETDGVVLLGKGWVTSDLSSGTIEMRENDMAIDTLFQRTWEGIEWID